MKLGDKVKFSKQYRKRKINDKCDWFIIDRKETEGIVVGLRTIVSGLRLWEGNEIGYVFLPNEYHKVVLVAYDIRRNPVYVPIEEVKYESH